MRRKSDKQLIKEFSIFLIFGVSLILFGVFILLYPIIPTTPYEEYIQKEVVILKLDHFIGVKGSSYDYIITKDSKEYKVTGEYNRSELNENLTEGTVAVIKYDANTIFPFIRYAEEIIVDGNKIVTYNNDAPVNWILHIIVSLFSCLIGTALLFAFRWHIMRNRKLQAQRDARIIKKYGKLKK